MPSSRGFAQQPLRATVLPQNSGGLPQKKTATLEVDRWGQSPRSDPLVRKNLPIPRHFCWVAHAELSVESAFSSLKHKFGDALRAKTDAAMVNESLAKVLCHNLSVLVHEMQELGIDPQFGGRETMGEVTVLGCIRERERRMTTRTAGSLYIAPIIMDTAENRPVFTAPPVVETILGLQFAPLVAFNSPHYGWFLRDYLKKDGWVFAADEKPLPNYSENFGSDFLQYKPPQVAADLGSVRMKATLPKSGKTIQIQPDKLYYSCQRQGDASIRYEQIQAEFASLYAAFSDFSADSGIGPVTPNLWEVTYINRVPAGTLWNQIWEWYNVLPSLFPVADPSIDGAKFATFDGTWHFDLRDNAGRVHLRVAKMIMNLKPPPILYIMLTARGRIGDGAAADWGSGLDLGHRSCTRVFLENTSKKAHEEWGLQS